MNEKYTPEVNDNPKINKSRYNYGNEGPSTDPFLIPNSGGNQTTPEGGIPVPTVDESNSKIEHDDRRIRVPSSAEEVATGSLLGLRREGHIEAEKPKHIPVLAAEGNDDATEEIPVVNQNSVANPNRVSFFNQQSQQPISPSGNDRQIPKNYQ